MPTSPQRSGLVLAMADSSSLRATPKHEESPPDREVFADNSRISVSCSWDCLADLGNVLCVVPEGEVGDRKCLESAPPNGQKVVVLEGQVKDGNVVPCLIYLHCDPCGYEKITSLSIISEARNMELYIGDEYYATGRGEKVFTVKHGSKNDQVTLYKKYLKLDCSTISCKIKLLSISEKQRVLINKIVVQIQLACTKTVPCITALGSEIDLDKVQTLMESMGSTLSPGAQQLLDMVHFQQKNGVPFGGKIQTVIGRNGFSCGKNHSIDELKKASGFGRLDHLPNGSSLLIANSASKMAIEDLKTHTKMSKQVLTTERGRENPSVPNSTLLLPLLQTVCSRVNRLRVDEKNKCCEDSSASEEFGIQNVGLEKQPIYLSLEKIMSRNMELTEKRLMDYIDLRMQKLQEHVDNKLAAVMDLVKNFNTVPQEHDLVKEEPTSGKSTLPF